MIASPSCLSKINNIVVIYFDTCNKNCNKCKDHTPTVKSKDRTIVMATMKMRNLYLKKGTKVFSQHNNNNLFNINNIVHI